MGTALVPLHLMAWIVIFRALLVRAKLLPPTCGRCGLRFERRRLGETVCGCGL